MTRNIDTQPDAIEPDGTPPTEAMSTADGEDVHGYYVSIPQEEAVLAAAVTGGVVGAPKGAGTGGVIGAVLGGAGGFIFTGDFALGAAAGYNAATGQHK
jgi:hypothetical protein